MLSSLWVSPTGSASDWCALQNALYKCKATIQYNDKQLIRKNLFQHLSRADQEHRVTQTSAVPSVVSSSLHIAPSCSPISQIHPKAKGLLQQTENINILSLADNFYQATDYL